MKHLPHLFFLYFIFFPSPFLNAQNTIQLNGKVVDAANTKIELPNVMVANVRTQQGIFTDADGTFILNIQQTDTIVLRAFGYHIRKIYFADSIRKNILYQ